MHVPVYDVPGCCLWLDNLAQPQHFQIFQIGLLGPRNGEMFCLAPLPSTSSTSSTSKARSQALQSVIERSSLAQ